MNIYNIKCSASIFLNTYSNKLVKNTYNETSKINRLMHDHLDINNLNIY